MAQLINITSEALQATIRRLLPSQQGFGEDLQASNVITPIIDLTPTAEGSEVRADLQTALAFGSQTAFGVSNANTTIVNTTGFYRVFATINARTLTGAGQEANFNLSDGVSTKKILIATYPATNTESHDTEIVDFVVFLAAGETLQAQTSNTATSIEGSTRQIADVNGNLVNPSGFTAQ